MASNCLGGDGNGTGAGTGGTGGISGLLMGEFGGGRVDRDRR